MDFPFHSSAISKQSGARLAVPLLIDLRDQAAQEIEPGLKTGV